MNMKKCCCRLALVALSLGAFGVAGAETSFHGVINPNGHSVWVDTIIVTAPPRPDTFVTIDWGSDSVAVDTFEFPNLSAWPSQVELRSNIDGLHMTQIFPGPMNGVWYNFMPVPPPMPQVMFYGEVGVEESRPATEPRPCLSVSPSVVTTQMTVSLQCAGSGRQVVEVLDAAGNLVRSLNCAAGANGLATATWHREDGLGRLVPRGVYFCRYAAPGAVTVRKVLVAR
jgi:hypothetical protein